MLLKRVLKYARVQQGSIIDLRAERSYERVCPGVILDFSARFML